jgi:phosphatidylglycerol lysyltransferase
MSWSRARRWVVPLLGIAVLALALSALHHELRGVTYAELTHAVRAVSRPRLLAAVALTLLAYLALTGYDALALQYVDHRLPAPRTILVSVIAYAFSQTLGLPVLTGGSIRYRFWSAWGLPATQIAQAIGFSAVTFWLGFLAIAGATLAFAPLPAALADWLPLALLRPAGWLLLAVVAGYLAWNVIRRGTGVTLREWTVSVPGPRLAASQLGISVLDWSLAAGVVWVLLPPGGGLTFTTFLGLYLLAQAAALASHIPGGVGVFDAVLVVLLKPYLGPTAVLGALLAYRAIYYLLPFVIAVGLLAGHEAARRSGQVRTIVRLTGALAGRWVPAVMPVALSASTFAGGAMLLLSGATPPVRGRLAALAAVLPLGLVELSHFAGSVAGAGLLVLAAGLRRRLDAAYQLTVVLLVVGIAASLLKGLDWEEAVALGGVLLVLIPARRAFYRRAALGAEALSPGWLVAVIAVVGASVWLGAFSFRHVEYANDLWWRFAERADAPRFLRGTAGAVTLVLLVALNRLLRPSEAAPALPAAADLDRVAPLVAAAPELSANLALLGDKALLFAEKGDGFLMYAVEGRSWVALGDPIGPPAVRAELAWRFREAADRNDGWTVFYEVTAGSLPLYVDLGLSLLKIGEEATVPLDTFSLEGGHRRGLRRTQRELAGEGAVVEIVPAGAVSALLPELRAVSDAWLSGKSTREKGFSLGRFDETYLRRFPAALVRIRGRVVAFANLWLGGHKAAMSLDLMRYDPAAAPAKVMEFLLIELMLWGRAQGFRAFSLGMAPLAGLEHRELAPLWSRAGALLFHHGEQFYNFQGLRAYKEKFDPVWEPRYLASPGGLALPRILTNVASLIAGGLRGVVAR